MSEVDANQIAAAVVTDLVKSLFSDLKSKLSRAFGARIDGFFTDFSQYLVATHNKCNSVRTIITKERPYTIDEIYVNGTFRSGDKVAGDYELTQLVRDNKRIVVTGFGGIGKTVFAKNLWPSIFNEPGGRVPVFLELRRLNSLTTIDIETYIRNALFPVDRPSRDDTFSQLLKDGRFIFILYAFDEINDVKRDEVETQILNMAYKYPDCGFLITSRYDSRIHSWEQFYTFKAEPFAQDQVTELIEKIEFDEVSKWKFVSQVVIRDYERHRSFLETLLLTLMMLMTFSQYGELPEKIHIFYRYAFQTLYSWHDGSKEAFRRERKSGLLVDEFEKLFAIFSMFSYYDFESSFEEPSLISYMERAKLQVDADVDVRNFIDEAEQSVNLLFREGYYYSFTHRSFQEYFTAFAISTYFPNRVNELLRHMPARRDDNMLSMFYELNPIIAEENYIIPLYENCRDKIEYLIKIEESDRFLEELGFVLNIMVSFDAPRRIAKAKVQKARVSKHPSMIATFEGENEIERLASVVVAMLPARYRDEVELNEIEAADLWIEILRDKANELISGMKHSANEVVRVSFDYGRHVATIYKRNRYGSGFEREVDAVPIEMPAAVSLYHGPNIKKRLVFTRRFYEEVKLRSSKERASMEAMLRGQF